MNPYRKYVWFIRVIISGLFLIALILVIYPFMNFGSLPFSGVSVLMHTDSEVSGVNWLLSHEKIQTGGNSEADFVYVSSPTNLEAFLRESTGHNQLFVEMVLSQLDLGSYGQIFLENLMHIKYSGFVGKTFVELGDDKDVPEHIRQRYEENTGLPWEFVGEGVVLFSAKDIVVLLEGVDYKGPIVLNDNKNTMPFYGYFEIVSGAGSPQTWLEILTNETGESKLKDKGLNNKIPALLQIKTSLFQGSYLSLDLGNRTVDVPFQYLPIEVLMRNKKIYSLYNDEQAYWQFYIPLLQSLLQPEANQVFHVKDMDKEEKFIVKNHAIQRLKTDGSSEPFFIKGVNLGAALPGKTFTEFPQDKDLYYGWLEQMAALNLNAIRLYTLLPPAFYEALYAFNDNREEPIYLIQEIWPEENPEDGDYLESEYNETYHAEIQMTIAALHGDKRIYQRDFRAHGLYAYDVSPYILAYLVGREMEPEEVKETNVINEGYTFKGNYFYGESSASPTEAWLASACDYAYAQSFEVYGDKSLVAIVSWPTLDPLYHDSEWNSSGDKSLQYNDSAVVNIEHIGIDEDLVAGFFGAYHIYPNYPDFMNLDPAYDVYEDEQGRFRYGGYLEAFMAQHTKYPAVVAEYGISTSQYTAHYSPDGLHHGGLSEEALGEGLVRMTKTIVKENYAGAIIFEWMDEWAKKTWTTEPYMIPYERHVLWHNVMDPEQNYGLLAYTSSDPLYEQVKNSVPFPEGLKGIQVGQNEAYIYLDIGFNDYKQVNQSFELALSTDSEEGGEDFYEFIIEIDASPQILVNPGYNWVSGRYRAIKSDMTAYERLLQLTNKENLTESGIYTESKSQDLSVLKRGSLSIPQNHIQVIDNHVIIRLPYGLLGISDPSSRMILSDAVPKVPTLINSINVKENLVIKYRLILNDQIFDFEQKMTQWDEPISHPTFKSGVDKIAEFFETLH